MHIYKRIRDLREDADKTQRQIAEQLYMQLEVYRRYETGQRMPPFDIMIQLANIYNVSLDYLAGRTDEPKNPNVKD